VIVTVEKDYKIVERVLLDGNEVKKCIEANDELGFIVAYKTNDNGIILIENSEPIKEVKFGKVEIILKGFGEIKK
jgi:hypothetical protein